MNRAKSIPRRFSAAGSVSIANTRAGAMPTAFRVGMTQPTWWRRAETTPSVHCLREESRRADAKSRRHDTRRQGAALDAARRGCLTLPARQAEVGQERAEIGLVDIAVAVGVALAAGGGAVVVGRQEDAQILLIDDARRR